MKRLFQNKTIMITGGTGTVGRGILKALLKCEPSVVRIFSRDESKQFEMRQEYAGRKDVRFLVGDVRDKERLLHAVEGVDYVFHTAAMKHVLACEYNPFEAMKTNLLGAKNIIESCMESGVGKVILTSTDKATNPCNTMGVSKLFAERLFTAANYYKGRHSTIFSTVRFGNIVGSRGSVVPLFRRQAREGGPITVTDPDMTRFVLTEQNALDFVFNATALAKGGEIFIPKMPVMKIRDLVDVTIRLYADPKKNVKVKYIGALPGEKNYEELMTEEEVTRAVETDDMFILMPQMPELLEREYKYPGMRKPTSEKYVSNDGEPMSNEEIERLICDIPEL